MLTNHRPARHSMPALVHAITAGRLLSHVMNWFGPIRAHAIPRSAHRGEVSARQGITGESIRVGEG